MNTIIFKGKEKKVEEFLHPAIAKSGNNIWIQCPVTKEWCWRNPKAWETLLKKNKGNLNDIAQNTLSNEGKRIVSGRPVASKKAVTKAKTDVTTTQEPQFDKAYKPKFEKIGDGICRLEARGLGDTYLKTSWTAKL